MDADFPHKVLVVDDDPQVVDTIGELLENDSIKYLSANSGPDALKLIKKTKPPFSLIIADQRMEEMQGTQLLEQAKKISPDTQRFLLTASSDITIIINAVNKGAIQGYIQKPWETNQIRSAIASGLKHFEHCLENDKLLRLATDQNSKLYDLNCELMETATCHNNEIQALEKEIGALQAKIKELTPTQDITLPALIKLLDKETGQQDSVDTQKVQSVLDETIRSLYDRFNEIANRNGFEMPDMESDIEC